MIVIRTKSTTVEYKWFCQSAQEPNNWFSTDYGIFYCEDKNTSIFVKIENGNWNAYMRIVSEKRRDCESRPIALEIVGNGQCGDEDACAFYNLFSYILSGGAEGLSVKIESLKNSFDSKFTKDFVDSFAGKEEEAENQFAEKIKQIADGLEGIEKRNADGTSLEGNKLLYTNVRNSIALHQFLVCLSKLIDSTKEAEPLRTLILTAKNPSVEEVKTFAEKNKFSAGIVLTYSSDASHLFRREFVLNPKNENNPPSSKKNDTEGFFD